MVPTLVMAAALAVGGTEPPPPPAPAPTEVYKVPGPAFQIPCKVQAADLIAAVQLWVSADRGKSWEMYDEITPDKSAFTFVAKRAGEYWFAPRIKKKDGQMLPAGVADLVATQRVEVATGGVGTEPPPLPIPSPKRTAQTAAEAVAELDEELTRVELELIRKEIKRLSEAKELSPEAEEKFDRLRLRLRLLGDRHRPDRCGPPAPPHAQPGPLTAPMAAPAVQADELRIPPSAVPADPFVRPVPLTPAPARPEAPLPRARGRSS